MTPETERVVVVEDTTELFAHRTGVVRLEARPANVEGAGAISLRDLVRQALRMRPDRLVVGEVRGAEVVDLLVALNTGHTGGLSTVHANSPRELPQRLEALAALAGIDRAALHSLLGAGVDVVVHMHRDRYGTRRVSEIGVALLGQDGLVRVVPALVDQSTLAPAPGIPWATPLPTFGEGNDDLTFGPLTAGCIPGDGHGALLRLLTERGVWVPPVADPLTAPEPELRPGPGPDAEQRPGQGPGQGQGPAAGYGWPAVVVGAGEATSW
jgi:pilus assembly protein CpaF